MTGDDTDDDFVSLPADYDDSEPGAIAELFARPVAHSGGLGDVLLGGPVAKAMSATDDATGGTLVAPAAVGRSKRKGRVAACVARVLKSLEAGE